MTDAACVVCDAAPVAPGGLYCRDCQPVRWPRQVLEWSPRLGPEALAQQCWADACSSRGVTPAGLCEPHRDLFREPA